jgi:hypothetical protein
VNHKKIQRIMRERGLGVKRRRRFVRTTDSHHPYPIYPNLIKEHVMAGINQVWVTDLTYIRITMAFVYLAVILDLYSRRAIGYALSDQIDTDLSLTALQMALQWRDPPAGVIHHSDGGCSMQPMSISMSCGHISSGSVCPEKVILTITLRPRASSKHSRPRRSISGSIRRWQMSRGDFLTSSGMSIIKNGYMLPWGTGPRWNTRRCLSQKHSTTPV